MVLVLQTQKCAKGLPVIRILETGRVDVLRIVVEWSIEAGGQDTRDFAVTREGELPIAACGVEHEDFSSLAVCGNVGGACCDCKRHNKG